MLQTVKARDLFRQIAKASWECADPGMQFDTTINRWHTAPETGRINGSNPCCLVGDTVVVTGAGPMKISDIASLCDGGETLPTVATFDLIDGTRRVQSDGQGMGQWVMPARLVEVRTLRGGVIRCTPEHRFLTGSGEWVEAQDLQPWTKLQGLGHSDEVISIDPLYARPGSAGL